MNPDSLNLNDNLVHAPSISNSNTRNSNLISPNLTLPIPVSFPPNNSSPLQSHVPPYIPPPPTMSHPMVTRSKAGISKPRIIHSLLPSECVSDLVEPSPYTQANRDPLWCSAMAEEYNALLSNNTWSLVPPPSGVNLIGTKWVFKLKFNADGSLSRQKCRLVAQGQHQQQGLDYDETFSHVVKPVTIRTALTLTASCAWPVHQLDIKNAFLHGLSTVRASLSMFIFKSGSAMTVLLLYVDDILLTASTSNLLCRLIDKLKGEFSMTDLGALNYFLGVSAVSHSH